MKKQGDGRLVTCGIAVGIVNAPAAVVAPSLAITWGEWKCLWGG
ncbi:hypothetical protein Z945_1249 [Sulfitobacter noctilucae]|nr:hypothetical protein Z945_1249 [Sulfitobacter noctilucae]